MKGLLVVISLGLMWTMLFVEETEANCLSLDGTGDYIRISREAQDDFTLEVWIKTTYSRAGRQFYHGLGITYADKPGRHNDFGTSVLNGKFAFGTGNPDITIQSATSVTSGTWVHVAAVRSKASGAISLFVNGEQENSRMTRNMNSLVAQSSIDIGGNTIDRRYFQGCIDEVRIWNRALTGKEISTNMNRELTGKEPGLVAYYTFNELTADGKVKDLSPSGNHGIIHGGARLMFSGAPLVLSPEMMKEAAEECISRVEVLIEQLGKEGLNTSYIEKALNDAKGALRNEEYRIALDNAGNAQAMADKTWDGFKNYSTGRKTVEVKVEQLKKQKVRTSVIEKTLLDAKEAFKRADFELVQQLISDAESKADRAWETHQKVQSARSVVEEVKEMDCDVEDAKKKIKEAVDALNKGDYATAGEYAREAIQLADNANCGKIKIRDLRALADKYDGKTVKIKGKARNIETIYGRGYRFAIDDGTGVIEVEYEGSMKGIDDGHKVDAEGRFSKRSASIIADEVKKAGLF